MRSDKFIYNRSKDRVNGRKLIIPVFVPHRGCPHDCVFCNQKSISGQMVAPTMEEVRNTVLSYEKIAGNYESVEVAFYGGSFTGIPVEEQIAYLQEIAPFLKRGFVHSIRLSTRPDCIDRETLSRLWRYGVRTIELGAQSMDDAVLKCSGRGHLAADTANASRLIKEYGFVLGIQTMTGLPGASREKDLKTAEKVCAINPDFVRIYPTIVIQNTALAELYSTGGYIPPSLEDTVSLCARLFRRYKLDGIRVIRMGLQSSETIRDGGEILAGPYHPAFGELVRSRLVLEALFFELDRFYERLENGEGRKITEWLARSSRCQSLKDDLLPEPTNAKIVIDGDSVRIWIARKEVSVYVGQKKCNCLALKERYSFARVDFYYEE